MLKSTIRLDSLIPFLQTQKAEACAMVNSKLYGLLPFYEKMQTHGIKPVIGLSVDVAFGNEVQLPVVLYAQTNEGYQNLLKISSATSIRDTEDLPINWLLGYRTGIVCVAYISELQIDWLLHEQKIATLKDAFGERFYVGYSRQYGANCDARVEQLAQTNGIEIAAFYVSTFLMEQDHFAYEVACSIDSGVKISDSLPHSTSASQYVPTLQQFEELYMDQPHWLKTMDNILCSCNLLLEKADKLMPKYPLSQGITADEELQKLSTTGLLGRLQVTDLAPQYEERLKYELSVISQMGYADYFLIVSDFMHFAKSEGILTGPGRGSSASSIVAFSLYITDVDPLKYDLLFERFLNPERVTMPDIDIDFLDTRRQEVIQYVAQKYGQQYVAQIITFGTLSAKAVARDVARMFNFESKTLEMISKLIPNRAGLTLQQAYDESEPLRKWIGEESIRKKWFNVALALEGLPRNASTHAAGVVLSPKPLVEVVPIEKGHDDVFLTQWPMGEVEQSGLLKMDFLGLRNLTILEQICRSINFTHQLKIDLQNIPLDDEKTFQLLANGDTSGVFQLESEGMRSALREIYPTQFLDIVAVNALYRPGPMDFIPVYARRKNGQEQMELLHPDLAPILNETYGVIVYQEQIIRIANIFAGFTLGQADILRRAVSKKNRDVLEQQREAFIAGAVANGNDARTANDIYELIVRFADYGFVKSHAVAYSLISYQLAFLKANFPVNFYAALLTNAIGNADKLSQILQEAKSKGIRILPPSISKSVRHFKVEQGAIRFSLSAIKGVSAPFLKKLMEIRRQREQPFEDIFDVAISLSAVHFTRKSIEPLIKAGALDEFGRDRAVLLATIEGAMKQAELVRPTEAEDLFSSDVLTFGKLKHTQVDPIPEKMKLQFEKEVLGFYLSDHPITTVRQTVQTTATTKDLKDLQNEHFVSLIGMVVDVKQTRTKKGELMAFVMIEDEFGTVSLTLFPKTYNEVMSFLKEDAIVYAEGAYEFRFNKAQIRVKKIFVQR